MDFFKKKEEPTIVAEVPNDTYATQQPLPPIQVMPGAGGFSGTLDRILALQEENNRMLRRMQSVGRWSFWLKIVVWALILGLPVIFFQQLIDILKQVIIENPALVGMPSAESVERFMQAFSGK